MFSGSLCRFSMLFKLEVRWGQRQLFFGPMTSLVLGGIQIKSICLYCTLCFQAYRMWWMLFSSDYTAEEKKKFSDRQFSVSLKNESRRRGAVSPQVFREIKMFWILNCDLFLQGTKSGTITCLKKRLQHCSINKGLLHLYNLSRNARNEEEGVF